jgi:hypothetical protein
MNFFSTRPSQWEIDALITISSQLNMLEKKVNILLQLADDQGKLSALARKLDASSDSLQAIIQANQPTTKG